MVYLHNQHPAEFKNTAIMTDFQGVTGPAKADVLVGTYRLVGTIYTLTKARYVVLFSPTWLKATEAQAKFRVKRIGQQREMECVRYVAERTIDLLVNKRQAEKANFDDRVLGRLDPDGSGLSTEEMLATMGLNIRNVTETPGYSSMENGPR